MKNILIVGVSKQQLDDSILQEVFQRVDKNYLAMLINWKEEKHVFEEYGQCFFREDVAKGKYELSASDMRNCVPLDDSVLDYMAPYTIEILTQQRRFEEYHAFQISKTYESHYSIYMRNLFFWNNFLETKEITHVFFSCLPHEGYDSIIYYLCKIKKIAVRMIYNSTLPRRCYILSDFMNVEESLGHTYKRLCEHYKEIENIPLNEQEEKLYQKWSSLQPEQMKPWYMEGNPLKNRFETRFGTTNIWIAWYHTIGSIYVNYDYKMSMRFVWDCIKHIPQFISVAINTFRHWKDSRPVWKRTIQLNNYYEKMAEMPIQGEKYIYFAMHYQPEASSNPLGGREYADQIFPIHILARSVPEDMKIYVKVHPEQLAPLRSKEYYDDIKKIPNVRLIKSSCNTYDLIQNAFAVSSLTGTACWEAQFYGVPAVLFGYSHKNLAPLTYHVRTWEECITAIKNIEDNKRMIPKRQLRILIKAMYVQSFDEKDMKDRLPDILMNFLNKT